MQHKKFVHLPIRQTIMTTPTFDDTTKLILSIGAQKVKLSGQNSLAQSSVPYLLLTPFGPDFHSKQ
jgi:hypothetical protein